jgi:nucleotide-binding universal stress UspA family protein
MSTIYKNILVPLDGSKLAETALGDALNLAELSRARVILLQALEPVEQPIGLVTSYPIYLDQREWEAQKEAVQGYLDSVRQRLTTTKVEIETIVEVGDDAAAILDYAHKQPIDLIVMATHGRSGLSRWVYGSVADKVLRGAEVPVLLVRAQPKKEAA